MYPKQAKKLQQVIDRLVDLLPLAREHYYHPQMKGSWSIKAVLPTVAPDLDYSKIEEVQSGTAAQLAYLEVIDPKTDGTRKQELSKQMLQYCELDTLAMVRLVKFFQGENFGATLRMELQASSSIFPLWKGLPNTLSPS